MRIVAEAAAPGPSVSEVARRHDISRQNIYQWRCELKQQAVHSTGKAVFLPVEVTEDEPDLGVGCGGTRQATLSRSGCAVAAPFALPPTFRIAF